MRRRCKGLRRHWESDGRKVEAIGVGHNDKLAGLDDVSSSRELAAVAIANERTETNVTVWERCDRFGSKCAVCEELIDEHGRSKQIGYSRRAKDVDSVETCRYRLDKVVGAEETGHGETPTEFLVA